MRSSNNISKSCILPDKASQHRFNKPGMGLRGDLLHPFVLCLTREPALMVVVQGRSVSSASGGKKPVLSSSCSPSNCWKDRPRQQGHLSFHRGLRQCSQSHKCKKLFSVLGTIDFLRFSEIWVPQSLGSFYFNCRCFVLFNIIWEFFFCSVLGFFCFVF